MWVVLVVVIATVGFTVARLQGMFGSDNRITARSVESLDNTTYNPKRVTFEVFGAPGATATINFLDEQAQPQRVDNAVLPWSRELTTNDPTMFADLRAHGGGSIGCRITVDGVVKDERSVDAESGYIACLDKAA
ncbi:hypothetical protein MBRU_04515 [Mycolicibacterium brumae DSM 44177]|nr:hypothetical protein MBRU_04515 [Mycolicibacterium brumae DSM 44177]